jgi:CRP/FNR family transcriptional regulator, cyclic AMP receptor protein
MGYQIWAMETRTPPAQSKSEMLALKKTLVLLDFSHPSDNGRPTSGICSIRSRRYTMGARVLTSRAFSSKRTALRCGRAGDAATKEKLETAVDSMATRIARHPFFVGMNRRQLALLTASATAVQFERGQVIFRESEPADRFYLIETGKVIMESSDGLGDPRLGWSWMFPPHIWNFTARAVEPITAIFFDGAILREHCEKDHSFGYEFLKRMSLAMYQRMQAARKQDADHFQGNNIRSANANGRVDLFVGGVNVDADERKETFVRKYQTNQHGRK